ncbi:MAG: sigma-54-dependent Fis family transcriptional regulator, partial [Candidatus Eisenbacteria bacterium]|nr:sigma-54-dependent Fis family transcriptional regulator [Candidatus Eisenbacteria bacterium]
MQKPRVLVIDDEKNIRRTLSMILKGDGFQVAEAETGEEGLAMATEKLFELVILDVNLPGEDGLQILPKLKKVSPRTSVVMVSGQATVQIAVDATRAGAFDFIEKPLSKDRVLIALRNALRLSQLDLQVSAMQDEESMRYQLVGDSKGLNSVLRQIDKVGPTPATVLVTGESGTGKELVARAIHGASSRKDKAFIKVNCAAIPEELIETELFGCVKGAYTGADRDRDGKFTAADGGTIFLDEIGDMSLKVQAKVLRALQEGEIERVGDTEPMHVDVRVIAATNKDLMKEVQGDRFREDLFYRLNVIPIVVPPLRERREDIPNLCEHFLTRYAVENDLPRMELSKKATLALSE